MSTLDIISVGMVTALGLDAASSCAAMRAHLDGFQETGFIGGGGVPQIGAPVPLPRKWVGEKRIAHLAAAAICEMFERVPEARGNAALILCLAEEQRPGRPARDGARLLGRIAEIVEIEPNARSRLVTHGRPGGHVALDHARRLLDAGTVPYVAIVGVDSYLTAESIGFYSGQSRLLSPDNPNGFVPGEAAAAVLCAHGNRGGFRLCGLGLAREKASIYNREELPLRGDGLAEAYRLALKETGIDLGAVGYRISDLIGEQYWFKQSALATLRVQRTRTEFQDLWSPGESLGNVGAAVVPLMIAMAFTAANRGYAAGNPVLVDASSDSGACGAALFLAKAA